MFSLRGRILKELAPSLLKLSFIENKMLSIAVKMPTRQVIPTAMIINVRHVLIKLVFSDLRANLIFSNVFTDACFYP